MKTKHFLTALLLLVCLISTQAQNKKILVMDIKDEIDSRMTRNVELALTHAEEIKADIIIVEMNTYGGVMTDAEDIVHKLISFKKPIWVYINNNAASAGALISIACDSIYMSAAASIGAATVVNSDGEKAPEKYQSYMRSLMRSTAEANNRDPKIAEGMVDDRIVIDSLKKEGQIITFSTSEALKHGYCNGQVTSIEDILKKNKIDQYTIDHYELSSVDHIVNFFMNPFISGILILIIIGGIYFELQAPGIGFPLFASLTALALYLVPYYLNGLAANWEILALGIGIVLIVLEIFVIPGFGIAGVAGIVLTLGALILIMINNKNFDFEFVRMKDILWATAAAMGGLIGGMALLLFGSASLTNTKAFQRMALTDVQHSKEGYSANFNRVSMKGKEGIAHTVLRPSGRVLIDGELFDAFTKGGYIEQGTTIIVVEEEGSTLKVKAV